MAQRRGGRRDGSGGDDFDYQDAQRLVNAFLGLPPQVRSAVLVLALVVGIVLAVGWYRQQHRQQANRTPPGTSAPSYPPGTAPPPSASVQMLLGNPSGATTDPDRRDDYLMVKPYFCLSYNDTLGEPNWVSWRVTSADLGNAPRKQVFDPDATLPAGFKVVTQQDYSGSGFDRGHMCPHSDRAANTDMSYSTFVMTNIIPQAPNVNQKAWAQLEMYGRDLARRGNHLYVVSGPSGKGGVGSKGPRESIANGKVSVPAECWKVIVVVPEGASDDRQAIDASTRVIAVDMPNDNERVGEAWAGFRTSPGAIEQRTGLHFFTALRPEVAAALRQKFDDVHIPAPRPMTHGG